MRYSWPSVLSLLSAGIICPLATALQPHRRDMRVKNMLSAVPKNWECLGHPGNETTMDLHIALQPQNESALIDALYEISTPGHPKYRQYLSKDEVSTLVAPDPATVAFLNSWFGQHGVLPSMVATTHGGGWLTVNGISVTQANSLFDASYLLYQHNLTNMTVLRTMSYAVPVELFGLVKTVAPATSFDSPHVGMQKQTMRKGSRPSPVQVLSSRSTDTPVTPSSLISLYNIEGYVPTQTNRNVLALVGNHGEGPNQTDLTIFMNQYRPDGANATYTLLPVGPDTGNASVGDATVVIEYTQGITYPTPQLYYSTADQDNFLLWLNQLLNQTDVPQTIMGSPLGNEQDIPNDYAIELCKLFAQLGVRGSTVIFATGDGGIQDCSPGSDGTGTGQFSPTFPAGCPFVTSVGGTMYDTPEVAAPYSTGGFSNYFVRPTYQDSAISEYFQYLGNQNAGLYNASGRGIPDISAASFNTMDVFRGKTYQVFGTDSAAAIAASVISLLNDYMLSLGKPPLGFVNPFLYNNGLAGINDISVGSNDGCNWNNTGPGFPAILGWDAATGLGSLDFGLLQDILSVLGES